MGKVTVDGASLSFNDTWSLKDFTGRTMIEAHLDGLTIYASCFYQEQLDATVFNPQVTNLTLVHCNIDNVKLPAGVTVIPNRPAKRIAVQNDLRDWEVDAQNKPIKVIAEKYWIQRGFSVDPLDIPVQKLKSIDELVSKSDYAKMAASIPNIIPDEKALVAALVPLTDISTPRPLADILQEKIDALTALKGKT